jgi:hypothetical protein
VRPAIFASSAIDFQTSVASFNDRNLDDMSSNQGSNTAMPLTASTLIADFPVFSQGGAEGGFLQYWCWIGGSCNADGSIVQSSADIQMDWTSTSFESERPHRMTTKGP